jgi:hypothetical protein
MHINYNTKQNLLRQETNSRNFNNSNLFFGRILEQNSASKMVPIGAGMLAELSAYQAQKQQKVIHYPDFNDTTTFSGALNELINEQLKSASFNDNFVSSPIEAKHETKQVSDIKSNFKYHSKKFDNYMLALYELHWAKIGTLKRGGIYKDLSNETIAGMVGCSRRSIINYHHKAESMGFILVERSTPKKINEKLYRSQVNKYLINIEKVTGYLKSHNLLPEIKQHQKALKKPIFHTKVYKKEIIKTKVAFCLNKIRFEVKDTNPNHFIQQNLNNIVLVMKKYIKNQGLRLCYGQFKNIITTFKKVCIDGKFEQIENQKLVKMLLGWFKKRCEQLKSLISKEKNIDNLPSMRCTPEDFTEYNGIRLDDQFVEEVRNSLYMAKNFDKLKEVGLASWTPSRDLINNKCEQLSKFIKYKITRSVYLKMLGSMMINAKVANAASAEYLL